MAETQPEKLAKLIELFWAEAERNDVLPIDAGMPRAMFAGRPVPGTPRARDRFVYYPPIYRIDADSAPAFGARSWLVTAELERSTTTGDGVILAVGTVNNGLVVYVQGGHLVYEHNNFTTRSIVRSPMPLPEGHSVVGIEQTRVKRGPAATRLLVDGQEVARGTVAEVSVMISSMGMTIGSNLSGISDSYQAPFVFGGTIKRLEVQTERSLSPEDEQAAEIRAALGTQ